MPSPEQEGKELGLIQELKGVGMRSGEKRRRIIKGTLYQVKESGLSMAVGSL